jgi:2-iminoacetate synthase
LVLDVGVSQLSGGSKTSVGGYAEGIEDAEESAQFDISDNRTLDQIVGWLLELGYIPSFCTACYREGRTGDRFMSLAKRGLIGDCCAPNALMTLAEYAEDYASPAVKVEALKMIERLKQVIPSEKIRRITENNLRAIVEGKRDFRF